MPDQADVASFDPDVEGAEKAPKWLNLSTVQIGAAAAASVTSALAASFFGVAGTLIGAAVGSIVSTVAGAVYAESMRRAADRVKATQAIVVAKVAPTGAVPSQAVRLSAQDSPPATVGPAVMIPVAGARMSSTARVTRWRRRPVALVGMMLLGFVIALGVITGIEQFGGGTLSGEKGSPSISRVFTPSSSTGDTDGSQTSTPSPSATPSPSSLESSQAPVAPSATSSAVTTPTTAPSASATTAPTASSGAETSTTP